AELDGQLGLQDLRLRRESAATAAEQVAEDVGEVDPAALPPVRSRSRASAAPHELREIESRKRIRAAGPECLASEPIVLLALFLVGENGVRLGDLLELVLRVLVSLVLVGMPFLGEVAVRLLQLVLGRRLLHAQNFVVVLFRHGRSIDGRWRMADGETWAAFLPSAICHPPSRFGREFAFPRGSRKNPATDASRVFTPQRAHDDSRRRNGRAALSADAR